VRWIAHVRRAEGQTLGEWSDRWRGLTRLRAQRQFVATLAIATLVILIVLLSGTYLALRNQALAEEQTRLAREAASAGALLSTSVQPLAESSQASAALPDRISAMSHENAALYQYRGQSLVAVAAHGVQVVGSPLPSAALTNVVGACGPIAPMDCHHSYSGIMSAGGVDYTATYAPVFDASGKFAGALMLATPVDDALAEVNSAMVALTIIGVLLALLAIGAGAYMYNRSAGQSLDMLQDHLRAIAASTVTMEHAAHATVLASRRQERLARQIGDGARGLDALVTSVNQGYPALQQSAGAIWAEVSHPGAGADPMTVMRLARETTLMATRIGARMEDARVYSDHITRLMNYVVAQGRAAARNGQETQRAANNLRAAVEQIETILGRRMVKRNENFSPLSIPSLPQLAERAPVEDSARQQAHSGWGPASAWPSHLAFPSIPPLPPTELLPSTHTAPDVINAEVRMLSPEAPENTHSTGATAGHAHYGDLSFPKLMKDATTRPLAADPTSTSMPED
jgi:hypothetical protein